MAQSSRPSFVASDGAVLSYRVFGADRATAAVVPLVMVQGLSGVSDDWGPHLPAYLARTRPVIVLDNRGIGRSSLGPADDPTSISLRRMALDVAELAVHVVKTVLPAKSPSAAPVVFDLLGLSMGGFISSTLATGLVTGSLVPPAPVRIRRLVLMATAGRSPDSGLARLYKEQSTAKKSKEEFTAKLLEFNLSPGFREKYPQRFKEVVDNSLTIPRPLRIIMAQMYATSKSQFDLTASLSRITGIPTLILHGTKDEVIPERLR
ncbi:Alpha/Beta hydrolase protein [Zopfochytrium polystomum]|nr:Alpha/Beta hydrolase protein [Zopfochytrium polystomum]